MTRLWYLIEFDWQQQLVIPLTTSEVTIECEYPTQHKPKYLAPICECPSAHSMCIMLTLAFANFNSYSKHYGMRA